jgi:hypothetical protein
LGCTRSGASISKHYASIAFTDDEDAELLNSLADNTYDAAVERAVVVGVEAYDWNCPATHHPTVHSRGTSSGACLDD